ncbi:family 16 glycosylhydrolase [Tamlana sp. 2_MG-2023]|uniref:family 16 glycosylhydrolase n=1 Tax=unclassified Tamlana TaxID=2614803 RepID=UPI0026E1F883|nr:MULTISPECIES: family 16 glycosylhydrolase [unclassified Tamlana]MDO6761263.1 family 16 glycosylhydrolase [Tamlana sp. 2_MG-2023]MDO6791746.1 family 16 glycosylhydrolase [Tamlana sp. 1_MG-2023]
MSITPKHVALSLCLLVSSTLFAQKSPYFITGEDPKADNQKWKLVKNMSDEFKGKKVDEKKWQISGQGWIGRAPGLFQAENINVKDGALHITTKKLPKPIIKNNKTFTHGGGYVGSRHAMTYGYYECEMKANKTFMSSTFWLINEKSELEGCDKRTTELDVQETVGQITNPAKWMENFDQAMNSNTHSRNIPEGCDYEKGTSKASALTNGKTYDGFHVYGVWWKSKDEIIFYLDGKKQKTVTPPADFDIEMYLRMVVETYNWNPVPEDGGMNGTEAERTTTYNWVRSWTLENSK